MDPARIFVVVYCLLETHPLVIFCHLVKGTIQRDEENVGKNLATITLYSWMWDLRFNFVRLH